MKKISSILEKCNDCIHCQNFQLESSNHHSIAVCTNELNEEQPLVLAYSTVDSNVIKRQTLEIPDNCPLEDYKQ